MMIKLKLKKNFYSTTNDKKLKHTLNKSLSIKKIYDKLLDPDYKVKEEFLDPVARFHAGKHVDGLDKICQNHYNKFEETMRVQNQYNRLVTYDSNTWHTATSYGNQTRYTLRFFINQLESKHQDFPLIR